MKSIDMFFHSNGIIFLRDNNRPRLHNQLTVSLAYVRKLRIGCLLTDYNRQKLFEATWFLSERLFVKCHNVYSQLWKVCRGAQLCTLHRSSIEETKQKKNYRSYANIVRVAINQCFFPPLYINVQLRNYASENFFFFSRVKKLLTFPTKTWFKREKIFCTNTGHLFVHFSASHAILLFPIAANIIL